MSAPDCAAMTAFSAIRPAPPATPHAPASACQAGPALARPRQACARPPQEPPATRHRALLEFTLAAAVLLPAACGGRSRNVADGAPDRPAGADGSGRAGGVACRTGDDESGFRPGAATATWRRRVASGARPARGGAVGGRASVAHRGARPDARDFRTPGGASNRPGSGLPAIDNDYQDLQHARRPPGQATDIFQANTLSLRLTYLHKPLSARAAGAAGRAGPWRADAASARARLSLRPGGRRRAAATPARRWRAACCRSWWNWTWRCTRIRPIGRACGHGPRAWCREPAAGCAADDATARPGRQPRGGDGASDQ